MAAMTAAVIVMAVGMAITSYAQYKQHKAQKKQAKAAKKERNVKHRKAQREAIRRGMIAQGQIENAGAQIGGSVGNVAGGATSAGSQAGSQVGFLGAVNSFQNEQAKQQQKYAKFGMVAGIGQQITSIGGMMMGAGGAAGGAAPSAAQYGAGGTAKGTYASTSFSSPGGFY